jgi:hypothetical protein
MRDNTRQVTPKRSKGQRRERIAKAAQSMRMIGHSRALGVSNDLEHSLLRCF